MSDPAVDLNIPVKPIGPSNPPLVPTPATERPTLDLLIQGLELMGVGRPPSLPYQVEPRTMVVGADVSISGEISFCDRLVVAGRVEASLHECRGLEITVGGSFKGNATVATAEIKGQFEGDLVARKKIVIHSTAYVSGSITYGELEINSGAEVTGILMADKKNRMEFLPPAFANRETE